jgi:hypothetical protein
MRRCIPEGGDEASHTVRANHLAPGGLGELAVGFNLGLFCCFKGRLVLGLDALLLAAIRDRGGTDLFGAQFWAGHLTPPSVTTSPGPLFSGFFEGLITSDDGPGPQSFAAYAFAAYELMLGLALHQLFADETPLAIEALMAAAGAERLAWIADRYRQFRPAAG